MKIHRQFLSRVVVAGAAGLAVFGLATTGFAARLSFDTVFAAAVSLGLIQFAFADYSRRLKPLGARSPVLRPDIRRPGRVPAGVKRAAA